MGPKTFYCNVASPSGRKGLYISDLQTVGRDNYPAQTVDEFRELITQHRVAYVMFQTGREFPRFGVEIDDPKLDKHLARLVRLWNKVPA